MLNFLYSHNTFLLIVLLSINLVEESTVNLLSIGLTRSLTSWYISRQLRYIERKLSSNITNDIIYGIVCLYVGIKL